MEKIVTMVKAGPLTNLAALLFTMNEAMKLYTDFGNPPPPTPDNLADLPPCSLLVTEQHDVGTGKRIGRIQIFRTGETVAFDQQWIVAQAS